MTKPILCLDFDGVIHSYISGWKGADVIPDPPTDDFFNFIIQAAPHFRLIIHSSRCHQEGGINAMINWLLYYGRLSGLFTDGYRFFHDNIHSVIYKCNHVDVIQIEIWKDKPPAMLTIDDRAVTFTGTWPSIEELTHFKPWNK